MAVWTVEDDEQLRAMAMRGASSARIAAFLNRKMRTVRSRARFLGCPLPSSLDWRNDEPALLRRARSAEP